MSDSEKILPISVQEILPPARPAGTFLTEVLLDYARRDTKQPLADWLSDMVVSRSGVDRQSAQASVRSILSYIEDSHQLHGELRQHVGKGKSRSSWIARQIERIASETGAQPAEVAELNALLAGKAPNETGQTPKLQDWNDVSRIAIARGIEQQSLTAAAESALEDGARQLASDAASGLLKEHPEVARLTQDFIQGKLDVSSATALQAALATATEVATRRGLLGAEMQQSMAKGDIIPAWFAHQTFVGTENVRVLHAIGTGVIDPTAALDQMADVATVAVTRTTTEVCKRVGGRLGQVLALKVPVIGVFLAPIGRKVGEFLGSMVGEIAGTVMRSAIKRGVEQVKTVARTVVATVKTVAKGVFNVLTFGLFS